MGRTVACYVSLCVYVCDLLFLWLKLDGSFCLFIKVSTRKQNSVFFFFLSREKKKTVRVFYSISRVGSSFFPPPPSPTPSVRVRIRDALDTRVFFLSHERHTARRSSFCSFFFFFAIPFFCCCYCLLCHAFSLSLSLCRSKLQYEGMLSLDRKSVV